MTVHKGNCSGCGQYELLLTKTVDGDRNICDECIASKKSMDSRKLSGIPKLHVGGIIPYGAPIAMLHGCEPVFFPSPLSQLFGIHVFDAKFMRTYYANEIKINTNVLLYESMDRLVAPLPLWKRIIRGLLGIFEREDIVGIDRDPVWDNEMDFPDEDFSEFFISVRSNKE
jgi:hypothetical protein